LKLPHYNRWSCFLDSNHSPVDYNNNIKSVSFSTNHSLPKTFIHSAMAIGFYWLSTLISTMIK
jgi:hypothetical protein